MGTSTPRKSYSSAVSNLIPRSQIPRKPKRSSKGAIAAEKYGSAKKKGRISSVTFQKKLVVFRFMSLQPKTFTRSDRLICVRGLLPPISVEAPESEVRQEICEVIQSVSDLSGVSADDFEFINMSGKQASVPHCKEGFQWNGRALKELAGSGSVYVRLLKEFETEKDLCSDESSDDSELPLPFRRPGSSATTSNSVASNFSCQSSASFVSSPVDSISPPAGTIDCVSPPVDAISDSLSPSDSAADTGHSSNATSLAGSHPYSGPSWTSMASQSYEGTSASLTDDAESHSFSKLKEIFPFTEKQLSYVYDKAEHSFERAVECLLEGPSTESLCRLTSSFLITVPDTESPRIRLEFDDDDDDHFQAAMYFYKQANFNKSAGVYVSIRGQPAVGVGVRRNFFSNIFDSLADTSSSRSLFEGPSNRLRPAFKASILSSGMLKTVGIMIAHNLLLDGQGFPYLADYCYYYIADCYDLAITCITREDVDSRVRSVIDEVCYIQVFVFTQT